MVLASPMPNGPAACSCDAAPHKPRRGRRRSVELAVELCAGIAAAADGSLFASPPHAIAGRAATGLEGTPYCAGVGHLEVVREGAEATFDSTPPGHSYRRQAPTSCPRHLHRRTLAAPDRGRRREGGEATGLDQAGRNAGRPAGRFGVRPWGVFRPPVGRSRCPLTVHRHFMAQAGPKPRLLRLAMATSEKLVNP